MIGGPGNDSLNGGDGDDVLIGGSSNDNLDGGSGENQYLPGEGLNTLTGGSGLDIMYLKNTKARSMNSTVAQEKAIPAHTQKTAQVIQQLPAILKSLFLKMGATT